MKSRIRSIKPEIHLDAELWDLEKSTGLPLFRLFTGLWNYADREGRFRWKPRALKAVILPWWDGDIEAALGALVSDGCVVRYEVGGKTFGAVTNFADHQAINNREAASKLPAPPIEDPATTADSSDSGEPSSTNETSVTRHSTRHNHASHDATRTEGKGREGNTHTRAVDASSGSETSGFLGLLGRAVEQRTGVPYMKHAANGEAFAQIEAALQATTNPAEAAHVLLAGCLADEYVSAEGLPPKLIVQKFNELMTKGVGARRAEHLRVVEPPRFVLMRLTEGAVWQDAVARTEWAFGEEPPPESAKAFAAHMAEERRRAG